MDLTGLPRLLSGAIRPCDARFKRGLAHSLLSPFELLLLAQHPRTIDNICLHWTPEVLLKIRRLSSAMFYTIEAYFSHRVDIVHHMRRWFPNVPRFLHQLSVCDGLVSGSEALTFLDRRFHGHDLDIYLPIHGVLPMGRFLKMCGYIYQAESNTHLMFDASAVMFSSRHALRGSIPDGSGAKRGKQYNPGYGFTTFDFVRPIPFGLPSTHGSHVQLIGVACDPMEFIVNNFHSTGVMNILTPTHAISLFPHSTFNKEQTFSCQDLSQYADWNAPWMAKYRKRGFDIFVSKDAIPSRGELYTWKRKVGDSMTWIFPYKRVCLNAKATTLDPYSRYAFEVLDVSFGVAPTGAAFRVGPRGVSAAWLTNSNNPRLSFTYYSTEAAMAFLDHFQVAKSDDELTDSNVSTGDTEEADKSYHLSFS